MTYTANQQTRAQRLQALACRRDVYHCQRLGWRFSADPRLAGFPGARHFERRGRRRVGSPRSRHHPRRIPRQCPAHLRFDRSAGIGGPGKGIRRCPRGCGAGNPARGRDRAGRRLHRRRHRSPRPADLRCRAGGGTRGGRRRSRTFAAVPVHADRARRKFPQRPRRPGRHHSPPAGIRARRCRRVVRARPSGPGSRAHRVLIAVEARELHGRNSGQVLLRGRAHRGRRAPHQPRHFAVSRGHDGPDRSGARDPRVRHL